MLVRFVRDFDWSAPNPKCVLCKWVTVAFKAGHVLDVSRPIAKAAKAAGAGEIVKGKSRD